MKLRIMPADPGFRIEASSRGNFRTELESWATAETPDEIDLAIADLEHHIGSLLPRVKTWLQHRLAAHFKETA